MNSLKTETNCITEGGAAKTLDLRARFHQYISEIRPADSSSMETARKRWNSVAKPIGSLGILEEDIIKIAGITGKAFGISLQKSALVVMCADHGVVEEGVTQTGQEVTRIVAENFTRGQTSVTIMCRVAGTDVFPVDIGMIGEYSMEKEVRPFALLDRKIAAGSKNIVKEAAMDEDQCLGALLCGMDLAMELKRQGYEILATGEMGIGNTTPSSALASVLTGLSPEAVTGRGAGLSDEGLAKKQRAVRTAVTRFYENHPGFVIAEHTRQGISDIWSAPFDEASAGAVISLLSQLGGFDIAGITGLFLGGAVCRLPVVIDGFISSVAALLAVRICETARDFILASHVSSEPAGKMIMEALDLHAPLDCGMHLGEGSGAVAFLPLLHMGADVYEKMSTFEDIQVETYVDYGAEGEARP